jgi:hypothetical protein
MTATLTEAWFIRPTTTSNGRVFLAVAKDAESGCETIARDRYGVVEFRTEAKAREFIRATYHNGQSFPAIRTGSAAEINSRIRFGALYC